MKESLKIIQVIRALKRQLPVPICINSTTSLDSAMYEPIGERDTEPLIPNGQGNYSKLLHFTLRNGIPVCYSKNSDWNEYLTCLISVQQILLILEKKCHLHALIRLLISEIFPPYM